MPRVTCVPKRFGMVEEAFAIKVEDGDLVPENFDSINRVSAYVRSKLESEGRAGQ